MKSHILRKHQGTGEPLHLGGSRSSDFSNEPFISYKKGHNILPSYSSLQQILKKHTGVDPELQFLLDVDPNAGPLFDILASLWPQFQEFERLLDEHGANSEYKNGILGEAVFGAVKSQNSTEYFDECIKIALYYLTISKMINSVSVASGLTPQDVRRTLRSSMFRKRDDG
jgi:hypothetical protein